MAAMDLLVNGQVLGVGIHSDDDKPALHFVHLQRSKNELNIVKTGSAADVDQLKKECGTRLPVALIIDTPRTLHRVLQANGTLEELAPQAFPGAALNDLYASGWSKGQGTGLSIIRKDQFARIIELIRASEFRIVSIVVGPWGLLQLRPQLERSSDDALIAGHTFVVEGNDLKSFKRATDSPAFFRVGTDEIPGTHALALTAAWEYLIPSQERLHQTDEPCAVDQQEERARIWYERGLIAVAAVLILLMGIDQSLRAWVDRSTQNSRYTAQEQVALLQQLEQLRDQLKARENLARQLGVLGGERYAIRAIRVLENVPPAIALDRVLLDPLISPLREREAPVAELHHVRIKGTCSDGQALHAWMNDLRKTEGIQNVKLEHFTNDTREQRSTFEIDIEG